MFDATKTLNTALLGALTSPILLTMAADMSAGRWESVVLLGLPLLATVRMLVLLWVHSKRGWRTAAHGTHGGSVARCHHPASKFVELPGNKYVLGLARMENRKMCKVEAYSADEDSATVPLAHAPILHWLAQPPFSPPKESGRFTRWRMGHVLRKLSGLKTDLDRHVLLHKIHHTAPNLHSMLLRHHLKQVLPFVYTPTVGDACLSYSKISRGRGGWGGADADGMRLTAADAGRVTEVLAASRYSNRDIRIVVVSDGSRVLGLGDLGANVMPICTGKLHLYTAAGGFNPSSTLPMVLDMGTDTQSLYTNETGGFAPENYIGAPHARLPDATVFPIVDEVLEAIQARWPGCLVQFEDFNSVRAFELLDRHRHKHLCFNDDIQGTGAVVLAGLLNALKAQNTPLADARLIFHGAGSAAVGVADTFVRCLCLQTGMDEETARSRIWMVDSQGLVTADRTYIAAHKRPYARVDTDGSMTLLECIHLACPHALVGLTGVSGAWDADVMMAMVEHNKRPIIFPLSNPTSNTEIRAEHAYDLTRGQCIFASGSPEPTWEGWGRMCSPAQANNMLIFPGVGFGAQLAKSACVTDEMFNSAAITLANLVPAAQLAKNDLYPSIETLRDVSAHVAATTMQVAFEQGLAGLKEEPSDALAYVQAAMWDPMHQGVPTHEHATASVPYQPRIPSSSESVRIVQLPGGNGIRTESGHALTAPRRVDALQPAPGLRRSMALSAVWGSGDAAFDDEDECRVDIGSIECNTKEEDANLLGDTADTRSGSAFTSELMNQNVLSAQYEVRGKIVARALELQNELASGSSSLPFDKVTYCNIGNPQSLGQVPLTFIRQVLAACNYPTLAEDSDPTLPSDVKVRAKEILGGTADGSIGAYSHSQGLLTCRKDVAAFLGQRDGHPANPDEIFLTDGASPGIKSVLGLLCASPAVGVMVPIPQYPLYSASIALSGAQLVPYYLDESTNWSLNLPAIESTLRDSRDQGVDVRALCVINPGNPTGSFLTEDDIRSLITLAKKYRVCILADEVYQNNVYDDSVAFHSFRKVLLDMGGEYSDVELISFNSVSKGLLGECGYRGGYMELTNIPLDGQAQLYKLASISLCPNINGQIVTSLQARPPKLGDASYELYSRECDTLMQSLTRRASKVTRALNAIEGVSCVPVQGAMYAFPTIELGPGAHKAAKKAGKPADVFFCMELLEETGVCVVPGSGFGQAEGSFHFRTTILPPEAEIDDVMERVAAFVAKFRLRY